jgi:hypothetical protein
MLVSGPLALARGPGPTTTEPTITAESTALAERIITEIAAKAAEEKVRPIEFSVDSRCWYKGSEGTNVSHYRVVRQAAGERWEGNVKSVYKGKPIDRHTCILHTPTKDTFWLFTDTSSIQAYDRNPDGSRLRNAATMSEETDRLDPLRIMFGDGGRTLDKMAEEFKNSTWSARKVHAPQGRSGDYIELMNKLPPRDTYLLWLLDPACGNRVVFYTYIAGGQSVGSFKCGYDEVAPGRWFPKSISDEVLHKGEIVGSTTTDYHVITTKPANPDTFFTVASLPLRENISLITSHADGTATGVQYVEGQWFDPNVLAHLQDLQSQAPGPVKPSLASVQADLAHKAAAAVSTARWRWVGKIAVIVLGLTAAVAVIVFATRRLARR